MRINSITAAQHSKILGIALIAYSCQFLPKALTSVKDLFSAFYSEPFRPSVIQTIEDLIYGSYFYEFRLWIVSISAGIIILTFKRRWEYLSLLFVLFSFAVFPLGTILSAYILLYIFVINENKTEKTLSEEIK